MSSKQNHPIYVYIYIYNNIYIITLYIYIYIYIPYDLFGSTWEPSCRSRGAWSSWQHGQQRPGQSANWLWGWPVSIVGGTPITGWFIVETPKINWMRGYPHFRNLRQESSVGMLRRYRTCTRTGWLSISETTAFPIAWTYPTHPPAMKSHHGFLSHEPQSCFQNPLPFPVRSVSHSHWFQPPYESSSPECDKYRYSISTEYSKYSHSSVHIYIYTCIYIYI